MGLCPRAWSSAIMVNWELSNRVSADQSHITIMAHSYVFELAFLNVLAPTFGKLLLTFFWMDKSIWIVCLLTLTFWLVQLQLSSILNKEAIIIIIIIIIISNSNRTEWSPIRSVIIRVINKIGRPRSGSPICLITSMITDWIGRHEVLLPINHNSNKICDI